MANQGSGDVRQDDVRSALAGRLDPAGAAWLAAACERIHDRPETLAAAFPAAGRRCGRGRLDSPLPALRGWTVDDATRTVLLCAAPLAGPRLAATASDLYHHGDAHERRGVLRALPVLDTAGRLGDLALPLVRDALRANDTRLVAAAMGPYAGRRLDDETWRQGVLKCVFLGIPLVAAAGLAERADAELARMFAEYARERVLAGRAVPPDVLSVLKEA
jgi:hypothetical protein